MASVAWILGGTFAALLALAGTPVAAQSHDDRTAASGGVHIEGLDVEEVPQLSSGTPLNFTLFGTPGAVASVQIDGARRALPLREIERGVYEGTYTIENRDRIASNAAVVATLHRGADSATAVLDEPLVLGAAAPIEPPAAVLRADGASRSGAVPAESRSPRYVFRVLPPPRSEAYRAPPPSREAPPPTLAARTCADCAVVESVRRVETDSGDAGVAGAVTGGVLGAILGNQIVHGDSQGFARVVGAIGGAIAGREFGRAQSRVVRYDVLLRRPDGSSQVHSYAQVPPFRVGDTVRLPPVTYARASRAPSPYGAD